MEETKPSISHTPISKAVSNDADYTINLHFGLPKK
jgi:hypothetical protein